MQAIIFKTFDFDPEDYLDKSLLFNLKKTKEEKFFNAIIEKLSDNDKYCIEHREGTNAFCVEDKKMKKRLKGTNLFDLL